MMMKEEAKVASELKPLGESLEQDLQKAGETVEKQLKKKSLLDDQELQEYRVGGTEQEWKDALKKGVNGLVSIPASKKREGDDAAMKKGSSGKRFKKDKKGYKKH